MKKIAVILFIVVLFSQGLLAIVGVNPNFVTLFLFFIALFILLYSKRNLKLPPGLLTIFGFTLWAVFASIYNEEGFFRGLAFAQYLIIGYLFFTGIFNSHFTTNEFKTIITTVFVMFFLQVAASLFEIFFIGRTEAIVGIMFSSGGGPATTFPMFAFGLLFSYYLYKKRFIYFFYGLLFLIVGYASEKLGVYLLVPATAVIAILLYHKYERIKLLNKRTFSFLSLFLLFFLIIGFIIPSAAVRTQKLSLKDDSLIGRFEGFFEFAKKGEAQSIEREYTGSRTATSLRVIDETFKREPDVFLFGFGLEPLANTGWRGEGFDEYGISYGITGWTYDALVMGWPGMILHFLFYFILFKKIKVLYRTQDLNLRGRIYCLFSLVSFFVFCLNYFFYNYNFTIGGWMIFIHLLFAGFLLAPQYKFLFIQNQEQEILDEK